MNKPTKAAILGSKDFVLICTATNEMSWWAGNLSDVKTYELCRKQLFQYLSLYVMFFIAYEEEGVITCHIFRFFKLLVADVAVSDKGSVLLSVFRCSLTIIMLRPCSRLKWMLRIQLREWEWMDLMFSLTCSTKLCTGALFIHQTRACSSNPLTKKFRINWQHQSGKQTDNFLPPVHDTNNIQYGRKEELSVFYVSSPRFLCQKSVALWSL